MIPLECTAAMSHPLMQQIVRVESSGNAYAIGVVGGQLERQPAGLDEAIATVDALRQAQRNYSIGIAQINRIHFTRLGWDTDPRRGFDVCANVLAGAEIFNNCYQRAVRSGFASAQDGAAYSAVHAALSCYYSGDFQAGSRLGYVAKVLGVHASTPSAPAKPRVLSMMLFNTDD